MKLACLSGRRLSAVKGASAVTMILATVAGVMPEGLQEPYQALKNSIMYTDDCQQVLYVKKKLFSSLLNVGIIC